MAEFMSLQMCKSDETEALKSLTAAFNCGINFRAAQENLLSIGTKFSLHWPVGFFNVNKDRVQVMRAKTNLVHMLQEFSSVEPGCISSVLNSKALLDAD